MFNCVSRIKLFLYPVLFLLLHFQSVQASNSDPSDIKLLVLIIASDHFNGKPVPIYPELEKVWRSYMHLDPKHIEAYFIKADPNLSVPYEIRGDEIWSKTSEDVMPGILNKTLLSLECLSSRLHEFDYVLRTNLSAFFIFPRLLQSLQNLPRERCYFGTSVCGDTPVGSGAGYIISSDVAKLLETNKSKLFNVIDHDDMVVGNFLIQNNIRLIFAPRVTLQNVAEWESCKQTIPSDIFQIRFKNVVDSLRLTEKVYQDDLYVHYDMLNMFYGK